MCKILNIETATDVCSVALADSENIIALKEIKEGRSHAAVLSVYIDEIFQESGIQPGDLDAVAVSKGPGSYTGLRIGVSTAKGICYGTHVPLIAVCSLNSMCSGMLNTINSDKHIQKDGILIPMIDARRMEVYTAQFNSRLEILKDTHAQIIEHTTYDDLAEKRALYLFGSGADKLVSLFNHSNIHVFAGFKLSASFMVPLSLQLFKSGLFEDLAYFEPYYLKDFITTTSRKKLF